MKKSMKLIRILLLISLVFMLMMTLAAQAEPNRQRITINGINFNVTLVDWKILQNGNWALKLAATGFGTIVCGDNQECHDMNLDGETAKIQQVFNLNIVIDVIGAGVIRGKTAGSFQIGGSSTDLWTDLWNFSGTVNGMFADSTRVDFQLLVKAGKQNMDLSGVFNKETKQFENFGGVGRLVSFPGTLQ